MAYPFIDLTKMPYLIFSVGKPLLTGEGTEFLAISALQAEHLRLRSQNWSIYSIKVTQFLQFSRSAKTALAWDHH
jgi:hypothetical protein